MVRRRGQSPRGERLRSGVPHGHWKTTTFVADRRFRVLVVVDDFTRECLALVVDTSLSGRASSGNSMRLMGAPNARDQRSVPAPKLPPSLTTAFGPQSLSDE